MTKWFKKLKKPKVLYSKSGKQKHPHIVVGEVGDSYISMNITHSPTTGKHPNRKLKENPEISYLVTNEAYIRKKNLYSSPPKKVRYQVSKRQRNEVLDAIRKAKKIKH